MNKKILILCTGNSCRSQMAEGFLKSFDSELEVYSAGTSPAKKVNPYAIEVMLEEGINISNQQTNDVSEYKDKNFDYVITVCDNAKETCPFFTGKVRNRLHISFTDPVDATGTEDEILDEYRTVRNEIKNSFCQFYYNTLKTSEKILQ